MTYIRTLMSGEDPGGPPGIQWADRTAFVFPWINIVFWGLGVPLGSGRVVQLGLGRLADVPHAVPQESAWQAVARVDQRRRRNRGTC